MRPDLTEPFIVTAKAVIRGVDSKGQAEIVDDAGIFIERGRVIEIGGAASLVEKHRGVRVEAQPSCIAMPGLINAHHHSGLTPLQLGVPFYPLELWLPRFMGMRHVDPRLDTLYSAIEMLESGTTTVHHIQGGTYGPSSTWGATADAIISAYREIGMRVSYSFMIRDQNQVLFDSDDSFLSMLPPELSAHFRPRLRSSLAPIAEQMSFFVDMKKRWEESDPEAVQMQLAPANLHWCSDAALIEIFRTARSHGVKLHMHLDETAQQAEYARRRTGRSAVAHIAALGCLGPDLTIGHGIWVEESDLDLLAHHRCCICHNASSGLRLASGIAPVNKARAKGVRVALGIDQSGVNDDRDMLQEMRVVWMLHREPGLFRQRPSTVDVFQMATENGAATTNFEGMIGRLDPGRGADIVLVDWATVSEPYLDQATSLLDALIHRAKSRSVNQVYVAGTLVVDRGRVCRIDRDGAFDGIRNALAKPLTAVEREAREAVEAAMPYIESYYSRQQATCSVATSTYAYNKLVLS